MISIERFESGVLAHCNKCRRPLAEMSATVLESNDDQGFFRAYLCDACLILAAKRLILSDGI